MTDLAAILRAVQLELSPMFEEKLRAQLADKDREVNEKVLYARTIDVEQTTLIE